ncbi:flagellar assembly protein FliX [Pseudorhodoplanes sp.]|jgi:hypothetical protein|uniref:flagellar assembly protein FliX n=1 Tax=Pseudorhodoplanes sp. TaxID=1934341 RepID=UPI002C939CA5|nr:flagellar assembly protein FliX [Pseudorhodoplanes sp.]HWV42056.1 flagellar assembly protein FliX [Pseudorhodoplanes sp.]
MRVQASSINTAVRDNPGVRRPGGGGFSLTDASGAAMRNAPGQLQAIGGVDVLVALQGVDDRTERRRRGVRRGRAALDALDALKLGLVSGSLDRAALDRLSAAAADLGTATGDPGLDGVLAEIDLRVQVEIAKLARR